MDCRVCRTNGDVWLGRATGGGGAFSQESDYDLAVMVSDFLENGSGSGPDSWCSSDSESGLPDLAHLADKILYQKISLNQNDIDLHSIVNSLILSINAKDLQPNRSGPCNASCIRFLLVKLLRLSGYDAGVCASKWQASGKVPGGEHEYIDIINYSEEGRSERLIVDIDFRSHFEIARAINSYDSILKSLPSVFVGSLAKLKQFLNVMVEAAKYSLKQNAMPLPPWRSLAYLQAKWQSPYQRQFHSEKDALDGTITFDHRQCCGHLKRLHSLLQCELEADRLLKPLNIENGGRLKLGRWRTSRSGLPEMNAN